MPGGGCGEPILRGNLPPQCELRGAHTHTRHPCCLPCPRPALLLPGAPRLPGGSPGLLRCRWERLAAACHNEFNPDPAAHVTSLPSPPATPPSPPASALLCGAGRALLLAQLPALRFWAPRGEEVEKGWRRGRFFFFLLPAACCHSRYRFFRGFFSRIPSTRSPGGVGTQCSPFARVPVPPRPGRAVLAPQVTEGKLDSLPLCASAELLIRPNLAHSGKAARPGRRHRCPRDGA